MICELSPGDVIRCPAASRRRHKVLRVYATRPITLRVGPRKAIRKVPGIVMIVFASSRWMRRLSGRATTRIPYATLAQAGWVRETDAHS